MDDKEMHEMLARAALEIGRYEVALRHCNSGLELDNKDLRFYQMRASAHFGLGLYPEAESDCCRVLEGVEDDLTYLSR